MVGAWERSIGYPYFAFCKGKRTTPSMRSHLATLHSARLGRKDVHARCIGVVVTLRCGSHGDMLRISRTLDEILLANPHDSRIQPRPQGPFLVVSCKTEGVRIGGRWCMGVACIAVLYNCIVGRMDCRGIVAKRSVFCSLSFLIKSEQMNLRVLDAGYCIITHETLTLLWGQAYLFCYALLSAQLQLCRRHYFIARARRQSMDITQ